MRRNPRPMTCIALAVAMLALSAPLAIASPPAPQDPADPAAVADTAQPETQAPAVAAEDTSITRRHCLQNTGSLITAVRNQRARREGKTYECAPAFGRVYTQEDLRTTGGADLGDILRSLDPSIR